MPLNLKLRHRTSHLQVNVIFVLSLNSFLGLCVDLGECWGLLSSASQEGYQIHTE